MCMTKEGALTSFTNPGESKCAETPPRRGRAPLGVLWLPLKIVPVLETKLGQPSSLCGNRKLKNGLGQMLPHLPWAMSTDVEPADISFFLQSPRQTWGASWFCPGQRQAPASREWPPQPCPFFPEEGAFHSASGLVRTGDPNAQTLQADSHFCKFRSD